MFQQKARWYWRYLKRSDSVKPSQIIIIRNSFHIIIRNSFHIINTMKPINYDYQSTKYFSEPVLSRIFFFINSHSAKTYLISLFIHAKISDSYTCNSVNNNNGITINYCFSTELGWPRWTELQKIYSQYLKACLKFHRLRRRFGSRCLATKQTTG